MSARSELYCGLMTGGSHSPSRSELASRRIDAFRAEVLREAADAAESRTESHSVLAVAHVLRRMADAAETGESDALRAALDGSSLGTPGAKALIDRVSDEDVAKVRARAREIEAAAGDSSEHFGRCDVNAAGHRAVNGHCLYCSKPLPEGDDQP